MAFLEAPSFPDTLALGASGGPEFKTTVITTGGGHEQRNGDWSLARGRWEVAQVNRSKAESEVLVGFFNTMRGRLHGFRFRDPVDFQANIGNGYINIGGVGNGTATGQLYKIYSYFGVFYYRKITKLTGTITVYKNGIALGTASVNANTGVATFVATFPTSGETLRWSGEFDVPVRFDVDRLEMSVPHKNFYTWGQIPLVEIRV
jgi:uncharacterized protein (TIGR02217 family)